MDLNLIRVFVAVHETRSVTHAADRLFVTQSAVSQSLARLRRELADPLFHRVGRSMEPTPLAERVFPAFRDAVASVDAVLEDVSGFDPAASPRRFHLAMSALGETGWLPAIAREFARAAPLAELEVAPLEQELLPQQLDRGSIDVAVTAVDLPRRYERAVLKTQPYAVAMAAGSPLAKGPLDRRGYREAARAVVLGDSGAQALRDAEEHAGVTAAPAVAVQHFATVPALLVQRPDLLAAVPASIAESWSATFPLITRPLPFPMEPIRIRIYRRGTVTQPAALQWFSELVHRVVSDVEAAGPTPLP